MIKRILPCFKLVCIYVGVIIGAGFASGQEIIKFFVNYGAAGILGLFISGVLFALTGWSVLDIVHTKKIKSYNELTKAVFGNKLSKFMSYMVIAFMFIIFCAMLSASGSLVKNAFNLPFSSGVFFIALLCFVFLLFELKGLVAINVFLTPILIFGSIIIGIYTFITKDISVFSSASSIGNFLTNNFLISSILYVSYNIITAIPVLASSHDIINSRKTAKWAGFISGGIMGFLGLCLALPAFLYYDSVKNAEIPILEIVKSISPIIGIIYIVVLCCAIITTATANCFSLVNIYENRVGRNSFMIKFLLCLAGFLFAHVGFTNFVSIAYPFFGYIGLFEVIAFILYLALQQNK